MRRISHCLLFSSLLVAGCDNSASNKSKDADTTATKPVEVDSFALRSAGIYYGYVPCADCEGIVTYLLLNADKSYRLEETYYKKDEKALVTTGQWKADNDKIALHDGPEIKHTYLVEAEKLWQLDHEGNRISGNLGDKYVLNRQPKADNKHLKEKADAGIDFVAGGNEPFWSVEIDKGNSISFNQPGMKTPAMAPYATPTVTNGIHEYRIDTGATRLAIRISPQFCSDGMSDFVYDYKVDLEYNNRKYTGCGRLLHEL